MVDTAVGPMSNGVTQDVADAVMAAPAATGEPLAVVAERPMSEGQRAFVGAALVVVTLVLLTQLLAIWASVAAATSIDTPPPPIPTTALLFGFAHTTFSPEVVLIAMVLMAGALGALVGVTRRFLYFAGREELTRRDEWSYLMRPLQGAALALIVYFTLRGGYLGQDQRAPVNPYGVAALSALVGLFTRHAVSKLTDVFDTLFGKPKEETARIEVHKPGDGHDEG
jgi:hypothetical protein